MPQLDQVTFFSQFFWLCIFFFGFYFVICKHFLPKMGRILKFRKKKMNISGGVQSMQQENDKVRASSKTLVESGLNTSNSFLLDHLQRIESWLNGVITETNKKQLQKTNAMYIEWVGDNSIRQELALDAIRLPFSPQVFTLILAKKCTSASKFARGGEKGLSSRPDSLDQPLLQKKQRQSTPVSAGGRKKK